MLPGKIARPAGLFLAIAIACWPQTPDKKLLTLEDCLSMALEQNPIILSALQQYRAGLARVRQAGALPQPSLEFDSDLQPTLFNFKESAESYLGVSQTLEFPGKRRLRAKIAMKESDELLFDVEILKLEVAFQVKEAFFGLLFAREKINFSQQNLELADDFLRKTVLKQEAGDTSRAEVLRARVEVAKAANELRVARNEETLAKARLNFLLARGKSDSLEIAGELRPAPLSLNLEELKEKAHVHRPELKRIQSALEKERLRKKHGYMSYLPDLDFGLARHRLEGAQTTWNVTLSLPLPLFFWQLKKGEVAEAEAMMESRKKELAHMQNTVGLEVEEAYLIAQAACGQIQLFEEEVLAQAEEVYNMFFFSYQEGEIGGLELIEARRSLTEARKSYADALYNYAVTLAALEKSVGRTLEGGNNE